MLNVYFWEYVTITFGEITFTIGDIMFTFEYS